MKFAWNGISRGTRGRGRKRQQNNRRKQKRERGRCQRLGDLRLVVVFIWVGPFISVCLVGLRVAAIGAATLFFDRVIRICLTCFYGGWKLKFSRKFLDATCGRNSSCEEVGTPQSASLFRSPDRGALTMLGESGHE